MWKLLGGCLGIRKSSRFSAGWVGKHPIGQSVGQTIGQAIGQPIGLKVTYSIHNLGYLTRLISVAVFFLKFYP